MKSAALVCCALAQASRLFHPTVPRSTWTAPVPQSAVSAGPQLVQIRARGVDLPRGTGFARGAAGLSVGAAVLAGLVGGLLFPAASCRPASAALRPRSEPVHRARRALMLNTGDAATPGAAVGRRAVCRAAAAAALAASAPMASFAKAEPKEAQTLRDAAAAMKVILDDKEGFIAAYSAGREDAPKLPPQVPFVAFQKLEKDADPEFMEAAIDYAEAFRGAKDLVKLAKLTQQKVVVSTKEAGKPIEKQEMSYGDAPGSGLSSGKEYAERAINELLGAKIALDAAIKFYGGA